MRRRLTSIRLIAALAVTSAPLFALLIAHAADDDYPYLVGRGKADVTGPAVGVQLWGFVRADQISEGIHFRLFSRAFVVAERDGGKRLAFASVDLGSITHAMHQDVVDRLKAKYGDAYTEANVILSATHTHSGPSGFWHYGSDSPIGSPFYPEYYEAIVQGITDSIAQAHEDLQPGTIHLATGTVKGAGANRSVAAYLANPEAERARYATDTDEGMTLLKFTDASGDIGMVNWFASHPTAMTFFNRLISGDHKGRASALFEAEHGAGFVGAFAQSNAGDITPNLNLNNTGPGKDEFETTDIIAHRQYDVARAIFGQTEETLSGPIDFRHAYVNLGNLEVADEFTGAGPQHTCPSAFGYAFAAGSTEDGGGHPLFKEGMLARNAMIDGTVKTQFKLPEPSDACRECQTPKVILFSPGEMNPPGQSQVAPMTLARIGGLTLVCVPSEVTTMAGRRLRERVARELGSESKHVVIVGYANDYAGYVTTREEYGTQQYEGGHTLFGQWTLATYEQEFTRLARAMVSGEAAAEGGAPVDMRGQVPGLQLAVAADTLPNNAKFGEETGKIRKAYSRGDTVEAVFWSGNPRNDFHTGGTYLRVERQDGGAWTTVSTDNDWNTKCRWLPAPDMPEALQLTVTWDIPADAPPGTYRIVHEGNYKTADGKIERFTGASREFQLK